MSVKQILLPSLVLKFKFVKIYKKLNSQGFELKRIPIHKWGKWKEFDSQTRLGDEICSSYVNMPKGHFPRGRGAGGISHTYYTFVTLETSRKLGRVQLRDRRARP